MDKSAILFPPGYQAERGTTNVWNSRRKRLDGPSFPGSRNTLQSSFGLVIFLIILLTLPFRTLFSSSEMPPVVVAGLVDQETRFVRGECYLLHVSGFFVLLFVR